MRYQGIIFDLDGVICTTDHYHYLAWKALADRLGIPFNEKDNNRLRGVSRMASLEIILEKSDKAYTQEEKEAMATEKNDTTASCCTRSPPPICPRRSSPPWTSSAPRAAKLAIGSASKNTPFILERLGLGSYFDAVADGNCVTHSKPDPEVFLKAAEMLGLSPAVCLVVEDAHAGVEAAVAGRL